MKRWAIYMKHWNLVSNKLLRIKSTPWRDSEADVSSVSPSSSVSDQITKMTFRALAFRRLFPIRLRRWSFERSSFVVFFRLDYEDDVSSVCSSSSLFPIRLRRWRFERWPFVVTCRLDYEDDVSSVNPSWAERLLCYLFIVEIWSLSTCLMRKFGVSPPTDAAQFL